LALLIILIVLFYNTRWVGKWMYPIPYLPEIRSSASHYGVDPYLVAAIIRVESNNKSDSKSHRGAVGLMQVMPNTAKEIYGMGGFEGYNLTDLSDPRINIQVGTKYFSLLNRQFGNNYVLAIAAYNAGPGNVKKWREGRIWDGTKEKSDQIPFKETRHYVDSVDYYYKKYVTIYTRD
jgi:soluble lytic murein transglycosylase